MSAVSKLGVPVERHRFAFQYVSTPTADTAGTTLLLSFDQKRYLFGRLSEGTQRACTERGVSLKKARNFFLTGQTKWETNGGLLGMILTIADVAAETGEEERQSLGIIHIHGGPKLWHTIACARRFIFRTGMPLNTYEASPDNWHPSEQPDFYDENILLWALPVKSTAATSSLDSTTARTQEEQDLRKRTVHNMFNSDWHKDRLHEATFSDIVLPAMIWVRDPITKDLQATWCTKPADAPHIAPDQIVLVRMPWPAALVTALPPADNLPSDVAMSYFVKGRPQRGKFMAAKAKAAGVPSGPTFGVLSSGTAVTLKDGTVVQPEDVMGPVLPGYGVAILDVPHESHLHDLGSKLAKLKEIGVLVDVHAFSWTLGHDVVQTQAFRAVIEDFPKVKHIIAAPEYAANTLAMDASAASTTRLNAIRPDTFMIPRHNNISEHTWDLPENLIPAQRGLVCEMAPEFKVRVDNIPENLDLDLVRENMSAETRELIPSPSTAGDVSTGPYDDVSVMTLGTGSALPSKYRNVSANLVHIPSLGYFMFDCGENTIGQLRRIYTPNELDEVLCNLHMIWISHLHADHHLGTVSILAERAAAVQRRVEKGSLVQNQLYLVSERNMADFLEDYKSIEHHNAVMIRCLNSTLTDLEGQEFDLSTTTLPVKEFLSTRVSHCHGAQAVSVTFANGFKFSYSGDCRPSASFAEIGKNSDILVHEATFDDGMEGDAMAKRHCTIGEALGVADAMKAKNIILTHFSQRYQKLPTLTDVKFASQIKFEDENNDADANAPIEDANGQSSNTLQDMVTAAIEPPTPGAAHPQTSSLKKETSLQAAAKETPICIAFDFMRVTIPQIKDMYKYYPAFESMFEYEQHKSDEKRGVARAANEALADAKKNKTAAKFPPKDKRKNKDKTPMDKEQNGRETQKSQIESKALTSMEKQIAAKDVVEVIPSAAQKADLEHKKRDARSSSAISLGDLDRKRQKLT